MRKHLKRTLSLLLVLASLLSMLLVSARAAQPETVQPRYIGTDAMTAGLSITTVGGTIGYAHCTGYVELYSGYNAKLEVELQQDGTTIKTWSGTTTSAMEISEYYYVTSGSTYQAKVTAYVYNSYGGLIEKNTIYSPAKYY